MILFFLYQCSFYFERSVSAILPSYSESYFLSLRLEREETLKYRCVCRPPCGKFNIISNDYGRTQKCGFSVLDRKHPFSINLVQKIKIVSLSWNFLPRSTWICRSQWWCLRFLFWPEILFLGKFGPKNQNCQL